MTLQSEILSMPAVKERNKLIDLLQKLYADYDCLAPSSGDEGSASSCKDNSHDESRNTFDNSHGSEEDSYSDNIPYITVKALLGATKTGYLERKQKDLFFFDNWQKRYCLLHKNILYIFKKPADKKQQGAFFVTDYEWREAPQNVKDAAKKDLSFELVCPGKKTYQFLAENKDDLQSWKDAILEAARGQLDTSGDTYEPVTETLVSISPKVKTPGGGISVMVSPASSFNPSDAPGEIYDEATSSPAVSQRNASASTSLAKDLNRKSGSSESELQDDLIYEPIDVPDQHWGLSSSPINSPPSPGRAEMSPPYPAASLSHTSKQAEPLSPLPLPPRNNPNSISLQPPPLRTRSTLPPPPSDPLPAIPKSPKKISPSLGKILPSEDFENMFYGVWACKGSNENELSFSRGQIVHVISRDLEKDNWWVGELNGQIGLVPKSYLTPAYENIRA